MLLFYIKTYNTGLVLLELTVCYLLRFMTDTIADKNLVPNPPCVAGDYRKCLQTAGLACTFMQSKQAPKLLAAHLNIVILISLKVTMDGSIFRVGQVYYTNSV